ncbi:MAG: hypothetical protein Q4C77_03895 [Eubacteriales bacterium]|nr:hypothetical protein [Eubacteriales bacterium]
MLKIGNIEKDRNGKYIISRDYFRQGMVFKDENAYRNRRNEPCYVPELSDSVYCGQDFLNMCHGQQEFADELFEEVDWQHPETLMQDWFVNNEWIICEGCGCLVNYGDGSNDKVCPNCGRKVEVN